MEPVSIFLLTFFGIFWLAQAAITLPRESIFVFPLIFASAICLSFVVMDFWKK